MSVCGASDSFSLTWTTQNRPERGGNLPPVSISSICCRMLTYADVCCQHTSAYVSICQQMLLMRESAAPPLGPAKTAMIVDARSMMQQLLSFCSSCSFVLQLYVAAGSAMCCSSCSCVLQQLQLCVAAVAAVCCCGLEGLTVLHSR